MLLFAPCTHYDNIKIRQTYQKYDSKQYDSKPNVITTLIAETKIASLYWIDLAATPFIGNNYYVTHADANLLYTLSAQVWHARPPNQNAGWVTNNPYLNYNVSLIT